MRATSIQETGIVSEVVVLFLQFVVHYMLALEYNAIAFFWDPSSSWWSSCHTYQLVIVAIYDLALIILHATVFSPATPLSRIIILRSP